MTAEMGVEVDWYGEDGELAAAEGHVDLAIFECAVLSVTGSAELPDEPYHAWFYPTPEGQQVSRTGTEPESRPMTFASCE